MRILISSEHDVEVLLEEDISPTLILQELEDRILEIEVSETEIDNWLRSEHPTLKVSEAYGEVIRIHKDNVDMFSVDFENDDILSYPDDALLNVIENVPEVPEIDMDFPNAYEVEANKHERLRRWVESHPMQWHKLTYQEIASEIRTSVSFVCEHLGDCVISAKYCDTHEQYKQKRAASRGYPKAVSKPSPTLAKIADWLLHNPHRWQSLTYVEISKETGASPYAVYKNLPKIAIAQGFVCDLFAYQQTRKANKRKKDTNRAVTYIVEVL